MDEKKYRVFVRFSCDVIGENQVDAVGNLTRSLEHVLYVSNVRNILIHGNGQIKVTSSVLPNGNRASGIEAQPETVTPVPDDGMPF